MRSRKQEQVNARDQLHCACTESCLVRKLREL
jgi:hypothetical protein